MANLTLVQSITLALIQEMEKDERVILPHDRRCRAWVDFQPGTDRLHRHLFAR